MFKAWFGKERNSFIPFLDMKPSNGQPLSKVSFMSPSFQPKISSTHLALRVHFISYRMNSECMRNVFENLILRITFTSFVAKIALTMHNFGVSFAYTEWCQNRLSMPNGFKHSLKPSGILASSI